MKTTIKVLTDIAFIIVIIPVGILYFLDNTYKNIKRNRHRNKLRKEGRATEWNPHTDNWN